MKDDKKTIELEFRAEIQVKEVGSVRSHLERMGATCSHARRLSVMFFGDIGKKKIDIRVRITNGQSEVVTKIGLFGAHNRTEVAQQISPEQFIGFVRIFDQYGFASKVGERETFNYSLPNDVVVSIVIAGSVAYVEIEKMSSLEKVEENTIMIGSIIKKLKLVPLKSEDEFDRLCKRLDENIDWAFSSLPSDYSRLEESLDKYMV